MDLTNPRLKKQHDKLRIPQALVMLLFFLPVLFFFWGFFFCLRGRERHIRLDIWQHCSANLSSSAGVVSAQGAAFVSTNPQL